MYVTSLALLLAILPQALGTSSSQEQSSSGSHGEIHPNIVLIITAMGYTNLGVYNDELITPNLNYLANNGVLLDKFYANKRTSTPARAQMLTGRHRNTLGLQIDVVRPDRAYGMPLEAPTLGDKLRKQGYSTHYIGKWQLGNYKEEYTPTYRGFDTFYGMYNGLIEHLNHSLLCPSNMTDWGYDMWDNVGEDLQGVRPQAMVGTFNALLLKQRALRVIGRPDKSKPLFLSFSPYEITRNGDDTPQIYMDLYSDRRDVDLGFRQRWAKSTLVDDVVGAIEDSLKYHGMWENTVFVFTSDKSTNGLYPAGLRGDVMRSLLMDTPITLSYQETVTFFHSPLFEESRRGAHEPGKVHTCDIYPTLLHVAGVSDAEDEEDVYGMDMWPAIREGATNPRYSVLHQIAQGLELVGEPLYPDTFYTRIAASYMEGDLKINTGLTTAAGKNCWLYNKTVDPDELNDLSENSDYTVRLRAMLDTLQEWHLRSAPPLHLLPSSQPDPAACPVTMAAITHPGNRFDRI